MVGAGKRRRRNDKPKAQEKVEITDPPMEADKTQETVEAAAPPMETSIPQYDGPSSPDRGRSPRSPRSPARVQSPVRGDPALDRQTRFTDICRNVDLAPGMYSLDGLVSSNFVNFTHSTETST